ncbi:MAG: 4Fe-4S dicluster domain-containing protein [Rubrivivax sp.]|nr:4Fe-4S dicluster domain-containing protein [Rubrivivax sp.]
MAKSYAMLIDLRRCIGCTSCQVSCKMENAVPVGSFRSRVAINEVNDYPDAKRYFLPMFCNHCDDAPCIRPCPVPGATYKRDDGIVAVDRKLCIGCGKCVAACPYSARFMHPEIAIRNDPRPYLSKVPALKDSRPSDLRVVDKCDFCLDRRANGEEETACQRNCFGKAIVFGDLNDIDSRIAKLMSSQKTVVFLPNLRTNPRVHYIAPDLNALKVNEDESLNPFA